MFQEFIGQVVLVRGYGSGVSYGTLKEVSEDGKIAKFENIRRIWYWNGAASISELATNGTSTPNLCKFPISDKCRIITDCIEFILVSEKALKTLNQVEIWTKFL